LQSITSITQTIKTAEFNY